LWSGKGGGTWDSRWGKKKKAMQLPEKSGKGGTSRSKGAGERSWGWEKKKIFQSRISGNIASPGRELSVTRRIGRGMAKRLGKERVLKSQGSSVRTRSCGEKEMDLYGWTENVLLEEKKGNKTTSVEVEKLFEY